MNIGKQKKDTIIALKYDNKDIPVDQFWNRRYKDSKIDNCITPYSEEQNVPIKDTKAETNKKHSKRNDKLLHKQDEDLKITESN